MFRASGVRWKRQPSTSSTRAASALLARRRQLQRVPARARAARAGSRACGTRSRCAAEASDREREGCACSARSRGLARCWRTGVSAVPARCAGTRRTSAASRAARCGRARRTGAASTRRLEVATRRTSRSRRAPPPSTRVAHALAQRPAEPARERHGEAHLRAVQDLVRQARLHRLLEQVLAFAAADLEDRGQLASHSTSG